MLPSDINVRPQPHDGLVDDFQLLLHGQIVQLPVLVDAERRLLRRDQGAIASVQPPLDASVLPAQRDFEVSAARALAFFQWVLAVKQLEAL